LRLVFVHGMRQEGHLATDLLEAWRESLYRAWDLLGLVRPDIEPEMPYYGDILDRLTREIHHPGIAIGRGALGEVPSPTIEGMMREFADARNLDEAEVHAELGTEVLARGPANWEWVQALGRVLDRRIPRFRKIGVSLLVQVDAYLNRPHIMKAVDDIVGSAFQPGPIVVVSHSLGTIVSYRLLRQTNTPDVPLFVTLGSPLGINAVKECIRPPKLERPSQVRLWLNGSDNRDFVALYPLLNADTFCSGIDNVGDIHNQKEDAHSILDYLGDTRVALAIYNALTSSGG
jgi:hypothetical protein